MRRRPMMRINKFLSLCGVASRRAADEIIREGRVTVNDNPVEGPGLQVGEKDVVKVDGRLARPPEKATVILFHKPPGCLCSNGDPQGRRTVYEYLPQGYRSLKYIGRLDLQSRGLLLFTDDGELAYGLTHPRFQIPRSYFVWTNRPISRHDAQRLVDGVNITNDETGVEEMGHAEAIHFKNGFIEMVLTEGKNREIRRMMEAIHHTIRDLKRVTYCGISLGDLEAGDFRELSAEEIEKLRKACAQ